MKKLFLAALFSIALLSGCTWKKVPEAPVYKTEHNIPIKVGVKMDANSSFYGQKIVTEFIEAKFFSSIMYPYREDDKVDAVLDMNIKGRWTGGGAGAGFITGLTLGLAGTVVGPHMDGNHTIKATLTTKSGKQIGKYEANATNSVMWGMMAKISEVAASAESLQIKTLTNEFMNKLYSDKENILNTIKAQ